MKRPSKGSGPSAKAGRRKASKLLAGRTPREASRRTRPAAADEAGEIARLSHELKEAREQQAATAGVLRMISRFPSDLQSVLEAIIRVAAELCEAEYALLFRLYDGKYRVACSNNAAAEYVRYFAKNPISVNRGSLIGRTVLARQAVHIEDCLVDQEYKLHVAARLGRHRTMLGIPLLHEGEVVGAIGLLRTVVRPFSEKQIELVAAFADEAVIAIENARLLTELRESLEQQTATANVLQVISSSPGDLTPVFKAMLENAVRICGAKFGNLWLREGDFFRIGATTQGAPPAYVDFLQREGPFRADSRMGLGRLLRTKQTYQVPDTTLEPTHNEKLRVATIELAGARTLIGVPLLKDDDVIGCIVIYRQEVRPFSDKQIDLVKNFAAQAVIAIENARLFKELRQSLERQTATSAVLQAISSSPGRLDPVFRAILANATRICEARFGNLYLYAEGAFRLVASDGPSAELASERLIGPLIQPAPGTGLGRMIAAMAAVQIADVLNDAGYPIDHPLRRASEREGIRTLLCVPIIKEDELIGAISIFRQEVRPFIEKQIELVKNFADQAVIAIENARLFEAEQQRTRELTQSLEQQTATSDVLQVISGSPGDLQPVFAAVLEHATRICDAKFGNVYFWDADAFHLVATHNTPPAFAEGRKRGPFRPNPGHPFRRLVEAKQIFHVEDVAALPDYKKRDPQIVEPVDLGGIRTCLGVPMLKDNKLIGALVVFRQEVRAFNEKQIALLTNFAAQAVIAIENARLLNELRQRTADLTESLEQQTATSEVLRVISSSPGELPLVFDAMLENAVRICDATYGNIYSRDSDTFRLVASHKTPLPFTEYRRRNPMTGSGAHWADPMLTSKTQVHIADLTLEKGFIERDPSFVAAVELGGARSALAVPMLKEGQIIGAFALARQEVRPFTDKQIALVTSFAAQAVIAIENARLLNELRQRTNDLTESLEQQTATAEVLKVISSSPGHLEPVFAAILENATRICGAKLGSLNLCEEDRFRVVAMHGVEPVLKAKLQNRLLRLAPNSALGRLSRAKKITHIPDVRSEPGFFETPPGFDGPYLALEAGARTLIAVPMLKENELIGGILIYREEVQPFTEKQIGLVASFAAQAVIAIENARLLSELRQRTSELGRSVEELRALGDVSQAVNSTLELETVLDTIVAKAVKLTSTEAGAIYVLDDRLREFRLRATYGMDRELIAALTRYHIGLDEPNVVAALAQSEPIQVADLQEETHSDLNEITLRAGYRARLVAPLIRGEHVVGLLVVRRRTPGAFPQDTVDLIKTFAAQSTVAIENARLFKSVETSLEDLRSAQDRLVQTQKLASLGQLTAGIAHEIKNPLNFVNNFSGVSAGLLDELREALAGVKADSKTRAEITELTDTLRDNLDKIVQHGRRADSIVKNMLLHSREGSGEHRPVDINALVEEAVNLAYHGARAEKQAFNITLERSLAPDAGQVDCFPQEITRVLLNLIANGFYAATKRKDQAVNHGFEPTLNATTRSLGDRVEIRIRDNGTGIPPEIRDKMFNPFFTTKPAGEGTGLGLSISHDIIVKQHSGSIEVDTQPGEFTEIRIVLPRVSAFLR